MKGITYTSIILMLLLIFNSSCYIDVDGDGGFFGPVVNGSGRIAVEERVVPSFDRIVVEGSANVILRQGNEQLVAIEADDNIIPIIRTRVKGGELEIDNSRSYRSHHEVKIYITVPIISGLRVRGSGSIYGETPISGDLLELDISGSGSLDLEVDYAKIHSGSDGSGSLLLFGEVEEQEVHISGSGNYSAKDLLSRDCYIKISGSGRGEVNVSDRLDVEIRGSGDLIYYGNPSVNSAVHGSGDVIKG